MRRTAQSDGSRGQTETAGFVLVIGMVVVGSVLVVGLGAVALGDTEERLSEERVERAFMHFESKASLVALNQSGSHDVAFGSGPAGSNDLGVEPDRGWMRMSITNHSTATTTEVMNLTLGALVFEGDGVEIAYQGGGVWRTSRSDGQVISPPGLSYQNDTLTFPATTVSGDGVLDDEMVITGASTEPRFPDSSEGHENPVRNSTVSLTIGSQFYRGWGEFLQERTNGTVRVDHGSETVELEASRARFIHVTENEIRVDG